LLLNLPRLVCRQLVDALLLSIDLPLSSGRRLGLRTTANKSLREGTLLEVNGSVQVTQVTHGGNHPLAERSQLGDIVSVYGQRDEGRNGAEGLKHGFVGFQSVVGDADIVQQRTVLQVLDRGNIGKRIVSDVQSLQDGAA